MNASFRNGLLSGLIAGVVLTAVAAVVTRPRSEPAPAPSASPATSALLEASAALREENRVLKDRLAELEKPKAAAPAPEKKDEKPAADPAAAPEIKDLFAKLAEQGLAAFSSPKMKELIEAVKAAGKPALDFLANVLRTSKSATERFMAAAVLEGVADPAAVDTLAFALQGDGDDMVRRMASHALAVMKTPGAEAPLRAATVDDADWGVRVNSAYGLAKLGREDGLQLLRKAYESPETPAEYRLPILGGLADVAAPSTAPLFRRILADTKDASYLLISIGALEKMKDAESIPALERVAGSTHPDMVKQAAAKAIEGIRK
jgi:HEAT repeat protein